MTNVQEMEDIKKSLQQYLHEKGSSLERAAKIIGCSTATLSNIINENWEGISDKMWQRVRDVVSYYQDTIKLVETNNLRSIFEICQRAQCYHFMIGICGPTGYGKSIALMEYSRRKNVFYFEYNVTMTSRMFLQDLLIKMGISFSGTQHEMLNRIADELNSHKDSLIIFDEVHKAKFAYHSILQSLYDKTMKNAGIVLSGTPDFKENVKKEVRAQRIGFAEFAGRILDWHELKKPTKREKRNICIANGIEGDADIQQLMTATDYRSLQNIITLHKHHILNELEEEVVN